MKNAILFCLALASFAVGAQQLRITYTDGSVLYTDVLQFVGGDVVKVEELGREFVASTDRLPVELRSVISKYPVILFSSGDCGFCDMARSMFRVRGIPFAEKMVVTSDDAKLYASMVGTGAAVPMLKIGGEFIGPGFKPSSWRQILDAAGYPSESVLPADFDFGLPKNLASKAPAVAETVVTAPVEEPNAGDRLEPTTRSIIGPVPPASTTRF